MRWTDYPSYTAKGQHDAECTGLPSSCICVDSKSEIWALSPKVCHFNPDFTGKWCIFFTSLGDEADDTWAAVRDETQLGRLGFASKAAMHKLDSPAIIVYATGNDDTTPGANEFSRDIVENRLKALLEDPRLSGIRATVHHKFKLDADTRDGFFSMLAPAVNSGRVNRFETPCKYYAERRCIHGNQCQYKHVKPSAVSSAASGRGGGRTPPTPLRGGAGSELRSDGSAARGGSGGSAVARFPDSSAPRVNSTPAVSEAVSTSPTSAQRAGIVAHGLDARRFNFLELKSATGGFSGKFIIGSGVSATVYRVKLPDVDSAAAGKTVDAALKLFKSAAVPTPAWGSSEPSRTAGVDHVDHALDGFFSEVRTLSRYRHKNIVRLLGYSVEPAATAAEPRKPRFALLYELCNGGDLRSKLGSLELTPLIRIDIAIGIASALTKLHGISTTASADTFARGLDDDPVILHRDVKSANIGLTATFTPKLLDCGLARPARSTSSRAGGGSTLTFTGVENAFTPAYAAPEVLAGDKYNIQSEIYSFGVVLADLLLGKPVEANTAGRIRSAHDSDSILRAAQTSVAAVVSSWPTNARTGVYNLMLRCIAELPERRPNGMKEVQHSLAAIRKGLEPGDPLVPCCVCSELFPASDGVFCKLQEAPPAAGADTAGGAIAAARHFVCGEDIEHLARMAVEAEQLSTHRGAIPCPGRGDVHPGSVDVCTAEPWAIVDIEKHLQSDTMANVMIAAIHAFGVSSDIVQRQHQLLQQRPLQPRQPSLSSQQQQLSTQQQSYQQQQSSQLSSQQQQQQHSLQQRDSTADAHHDDTVAALRLKFIDDVLNLRCPRCKSVFVEYSGCDAVQCARPGCGCHFCGLCLADCDTSKKAHAHVRAANHHRDNSGVYGGDAKFRRFHANRRLSGLVDNLSSLVAPDDFKARVVDSLEVDLLGLGINVDELRAALGLGVGAPTAAALAWRGDLTVPSTATGDPTAVSAVAVSSAGLMTATAVPGTSQQPHRGHHQLQQQQQQQAAALAQAQQHEQQPWQPQQQPQQQQRAQQRTATLAELQQHRQQEHHQQQQLAQQQQQQQQQQQRAQQQAPVTSDNGNSLATLMPAFMNMALGAIGSSPSASPLGSAGNAIMQMALGSIGSSPGPRSTPGQSGGYMGSLGGASGLGGQQQQLAQQIQQQQHWLHGRQQLPAQQWHGLQQRGQQAQHGQQVQHGQQQQQQQQQQQAALRSLEKHFFW